MRRFVLLTSLVLLSACLAGCSRPPGAGAGHEALVEDIASHLTQMNAILAEVNDAASAKAAAPRLTQLKDDWQEIEELLVAMDEPDEATMARISTIYEERIANLMMELMEHAFRLGEQPGAMDELASALPFTGW